MSPKLGEMSGMVHCQVLTLNCGRRSVALSVEAEAIIGIGGGAALTVYDVKR